MHCLILFPTSVARGEYLHSLRRYGHGGARVCCTYVWWSKFSSFDSGSMMYLRPADERHSCTSGRTRSRRLVGGIYWLGSLVVRQILLNSQFSL